MWQYEDKNWYLNKSGNSIWYIENNPCNCCPDSYMVEYRSPVTGNRNVIFHVSSHDGIKRILDQRQLIRLEKGDANGE